MVRVFVLDTFSIIDYFSEVFNVFPTLSRRAHRIIELAFQGDPYTRLSIPSIVFVEIYEKWFKSEEFCAMFRAEVLELINSSPCIEIKPIDQEVLENFNSIRDDIINLENHDKIILASAMMLKCPLITIDPKIIKYVTRDKVIPEVIE